MEQMSPTVIAWALFCWVDLTNHKFSLGLKSCQRHMSYHIFTDDVISLSVTGMTKIMRFIKDIPVDRYVTIYIYLCIYTDKKFIIFLKICW